MTLRLMLRRVLALLRARSYDRDLDDEVLAHLELAERDAIAAGMSPEEARREARRRFGGVDVMKEDHRDRRSARWLEAFGKDVRYAFRSLRRDRTFTVVAITVLTLAIGAGTTIFSVVDAVVLRGLPFDEHDRLTVIREYRLPPQQTPYLGITTMQTFLDWRREQQSFSAITGVAGTRLRVQRADGSPVELLGQRVSHEFFDVLRVAPALGRTFSSEEETDGRHRVAVLSHGFWQRAFAGSPDVLGRSIEVDDEPWTIVGVLPRGFDYPVAASRPTEIYVPIRIREVDRVRGDTRNYNITVIGRLAPGVSSEQAGTDISSITSRLAGEFPAWFSERVTDVVPLHAHVVAGPRAWMLLLLGAVAVVLLIACANVANLMLARSTVRTRETTMRAALGANRSRLIRGVVIEGLLVSTMASALAVALAYGGVAAVAAWLPHDLPRISSVAVDLRVLAAALLAALATGIAFSFVPALQFSTPDLNRALRDGGRSVVSRAGERARSAFVVVEIAFATFLVIGASLFVGSLFKWTRVDVGFEHRNVMAIPGVGLRFNQREFADASARGAEALAEYRRAIRLRQEAYVKDVMAAIAAVPGVTDVAAVNGGVPLTGSYSNGPVEVPERTIPPGPENQIGYRRVTPNYASILRMPLRQGRYLTDADLSTAAKVAVVNESAARWLWPAESAIGRRLTASGQQYTVVGVVGDIRQRGPDVPVGPELHMPIVDDWPGAQLIVRTWRDSRLVLPDVRTAILRVNGDQLLAGDVFALEDYLDRQVAQRRFTMAMFAVLGLVGLVTAVAGVYGVMAYTVSQRRQEIAVRMALGAQPSTVVSMVLGRSAVLIVTGLAIGTACAWYLSSAVEAFLFQLSPTDVRVYATAIAALGLAGLVASIVPARRAARVDPIIALRAE